MYANIAVRCVLPIEEGGVARWKGRNKEYIWSFWMFYDIAANIPFDYIGLIVGSKCTVSFNRCGLLAPYWQLNRLLNVRGFIDTTMEAVERFLQKLHIHPYAALVIVVTLVQTYFWHLFACFLFLDVVRRGNRFELITNVRVNDTDTYLIDAPVSLQYAASLDWSSKVLAGWDRGAEFALDTWTFVFNAVTVLFGLCLMTTFVSFVSGLVEMLTPYITQTMDVDMVFDFVKYKKGPDDLRDEMIIDSWYRYDSKTHMLVATEVLGELPEELHDRLLDFEGRRVLGRVKLFAPQLQNKSFVINVAKQLVPVIMAPGEVLFEKGDAGESMYFIIDGYLGVVNEDDHSDVRFRLGPGMFVGEIALLLGASRTATVVVLDNFVRMLSLNKKEFEVLKRRFPNTFAQVHQKARDRWMELNQSLLEKARELGRQEIEEIAKKRFKLAQMKIHNIAQMGSTANSKSSSNDMMTINVDPGSCELGGALSSSSNTESEKMLNGLLKTATGGGTRKRSPSTNLSIVAMQAQIQEAKGGHSTAVSPMVAEAAPDQQQNGNGGDGQETRERRAGRDMATSMFGPQKTKSSDILSPSANASPRAGNAMPSKNPSPKAMSEGIISDPISSSEGESAGKSVFDELEEEKKKKKELSARSNKNEDSAELVLRDNLERAATNNDNENQQLSPFAPNNNNRNNNDPTQQSFLGAYRPNNNNNNNDGVGEGGMGEPVASCDATERQFFTRARSDSQTAFLKQFLKDTMTAQAIPISSSNNTQNDDDDLNDDNQQQQQDRQNNNTAAHHRPMLMTSDGSVFPVTNSAEQDDGEDADDENTQQQNYNSEDDVVLVMQEESGGSYGEASNNQQEQPRESSPNRKEHQQQQGAADQVFMVDDGMQ